MKTWGTLTHTFSLHFIAWSTFYTLMYAYFAVTNQAKVDKEHQKKFTYNAVTIEVDLFIHKANKYFLLCIIIIIRRMMI